MKERKAFERILSLVLALVMLVGMVPATALPVFAAADVSTTTTNVNTVTAYAQKLFADNVNYAGATSKPDRDSDGAEDDPIFTWDTEGKADAWRYYNGLVIDAFLMAGTSSGEKTAENFAKAYYDANINLNNPSWTTRTFDANPLGLEVDSIAPIRGLFDLLTKQDDGSYETFLNNVYGALADPDDGTGKSYAQLSTSKFTYYPEAGGNYIHKPGWIKESPGWHIGLDGLYMAQPFLAEYAAALNGGKLTNSSADCYTIFGKIYDRFVWVLDTMDMSVADSSGKTVKLYHHGWNVDTNTGNGVVWARGVGWLAAALVDVLELMPAEEKYDAYREGLIARLQVLLDGMLAFQETDGMWNNVVYPAYAGTDDYPNKPETSGTALMAYALMKAYNNGWVGSAYGKAGLNAFNAVVTGYCSAESMTNIYRSASVGTTAEAYCVSEKYNCDGEGKGVGPLIMAAAVANNAAERLEADSTPTLTLPVYVLNMDQAASVTVAATVTNGAAGSYVTWTSSDENVAKVVNGKITAVNKGTALITAAYTTGTAALADDVPYTSQATIQVNVTDADAAATVNGKVSVAHTYEFSRYTGELVAGQYLVVDTNKVSKDLDGNTLDPYVYLTRAAYFDSNHNNNRFSSGEVTIKTENGVEKAVLPEGVDPAPYLITFEAATDGGFYVFGSYEGKTRYIVSGNADYLGDDPTSLTIKKKENEYVIFIGYDDDNNLRSLRLNNSLVDSTAPGTPQFTRNTGEETLMFYSVSGDPAQEYDVVLSVDKSQLVMEYGKTQVLTPTVKVTKPDGTEVALNSYTTAWTSTNPNAATVADGTVTAANSAGSTTVVLTLSEITLSDGTEYSLNTPITVEVPVDVVEWNDEGWATVTTNTVKLGTEGSVTFTLAGTVAAGNFGFLDNVKLVNADTGEIITLENGDFESGYSGNGIPANWTVSDSLTWKLGNQAAAYNSTNRLNLYQGSESAVSAEVTANVPAGSYYFTYDIIGNTGLTGTASASENQVTTYSLVMTPNADQTIMLGETLNVSATFTASDGNYDNFSYEWCANPIDGSDNETWGGQGSSACDGSENTWSFTPAATGTYRIYYKVYDEANDWTVKEEKSFLLTVKEETYWLKCEGFSSDVSEGYEITTDMKTWTFTATSTGTDTWDMPVFIVNAAIEADKDTLPAKRDLTIRSDDGILVDLSANWAQTGAWTDQNAKYMTYDFGTMGEEERKAWVDGNQSEDGVECKVTAQLVDDRIVIGVTANGYTKYYIMKNTADSANGEKPYLYISGEDCYVKDAPTVSSSTADAVEGFADAAACTMSADLAVKEIWICEDDISNGTVDKTALANAISAQNKGNASITVNTAYSDGTTGTGTVEADNGVARQLTKRPNGEDQLVVAYSDGIFTAVTSIKVNIYSAVTGELSVATKNDAAALPVGDTLQASAVDNADSVTATSGITWSSGDETIATVDENGLITGKSIGKVTITATWFDGTTTKTATKEIEVLPKLDGYGITVYEGETGKVIVQVQAGGTCTYVVKFTADSSEYFTVEDAGNGVVRGVAATTALSDADAKNVKVTIQLMSVTKDGVTTDYRSYNITSGATIKVLPATEYTLSEIGDMQLSLGGTATLGTTEGYSLTVNVADDGAENVTDRATIQWSSSNPNVVTVDENGKLTVVGYSEEPITITATLTHVDGTAVHNQVSESFAVTINKPTIWVAQMGAGNSATGSVFYPEQQRQALYSVSVPEGMTCTIEWVAINPEYATVNEDGVVTAHAVTSGLNGGCASVRAYITSVNGTKVTGVYHQFGVYVMPDYISSSRLTMNPVLVVDAGISKEDLTKMLQAETGAQATWLSEKTTTVAGENLSFDLTDFNGGTVGSYKIPVSYTYQSSDGTTTDSLGELEVIVLNAGSNGYSLPVAQYLLNTEEIVNGEIYVIVAEVDGTYYALGMKSNENEYLELDATVEGNVLTVAGADKSYELTFTEVGKTTNGSMGTYVHYYIHSKSVNLYLSDNGYVPNSSKKEIAVIPVANKNNNAFYFVTQIAKTDTRVIGINNEGQWTMLLKKEQGLDGLESQLGTTAATGMLYLYKKYVEMDYGSIAFDVTEKAYELKAGNTAEPVESVTADGSAPVSYVVTWSSLDESIASVDENGKITAVAPGVTQIMVTLSQVTTATGDRDVYDLDGSAGITKIITVTVPDEGYQLGGKQSVTVNKNGALSFEGIEVYADSDTSTPIDASRVSFDLADAVRTDISGGSSVGLNTGMPGTYQVPVYVDGLKTDLVVTVTVLEEVYKGVDFITDIGDLPQYPEPGSVAIDKTATGLNFINSGVAQIELDVAGMSANGGVDVILVVDVSNSMGWDMDNTDGADDAAKVPNSLADDDKLDNVMDAATEFAKVLLADQELGNTISFVTFAGYDQQHTSGIKPSDLNLVDSVQTVFYGVTDPALAQTSFQGTRFVKYDKGTNDDGTLTGSVGYYLEIRDENGQLVTGVMTPVDKDGNMNYVSYSVMVGAAANAVVDDEGWVTVNGSREFSFTQDARTDGKGDVFTYTVTNGTLTCTKQTYVKDSNGNSVADGSSAIQWEVQNFAGWKVSAGKNRGNTNYDYGFGQAMEAVDQVKEAWLSNPVNVNGTTYENSGRETYVIFMTDGAPTHYNGIRRQGTSPDLIWNGDELYTTHSTEHSNVDVNAADWLAFVNRYNELATELYSTVDGMYNIAFDIEHGAFGDYSFESDALLSVLTGVVKNQNIETLNAEDPNILTAFYKELAESLKYAGKDAVVKDELSAFYTLYTGQETTGQKVTPTIAIKAYTLYTVEDVGAPIYRMVDGAVQQVGSVTADMVGERVRDVNGLYVTEIIEQVTFISATSAYSQWYEDGVLKGTLNDITTVTNGVVTQIKGRYFTYTRDNKASTEDTWYPEGSSTNSDVTVAPGEINTTETKQYKETFTWNIGDIPEREVALIYTAYLNGAYDSQDRYAGMYPTNHEAHLYFTTADGDYAKLAFPEPEMSWKDQMFAIRFHLVNEAGEPINYHGLPTGSTAILSEVGERIFQWIELDTSKQSCTLYAQQALAELKKLDPEKYGNFALCDATAYYTRDGIASTNHTVSGKGIVFLGMTPDGYQTGISIGIVINKVAPDQVVIDYGKPIYVDVVTNDKAATIEVDGTKYGKFSSVELVGIVSYGANGIGSIAALDGTMLQNLNGLSLDGRVATQQGYFSILGGKVLFTPTQLLDEVQRVYAILKVTEHGKDTSVYYANRVDVIPATVMYYETDFGQDIFVPQTSDTGLDLNFPGYLTYGWYPSASGASANITGPGTYTISWTPPAVEDDAGCNIFYIDILNAATALADYTCSVVSVTVDGKPITVDSSKLWYGPWDGAWRITLYDEIWKTDTSWNPPTREFAVDPTAFAGMSSNVTITFTLIDPNASAGNSGAATRAEDWENVAFTGQTDDQGTVNTPVTSVNTWIQDDGTVGHEGHTYGYDSHYSATDLNDNDTQYDNYLSDGSSLYVEGRGVDKTQIGFTFTGTGFDIISRTDKYQGTIRVWVYSMTTGQLVRNVAVINKGVNVLYQIPVVSVEGLEYGEYKVVIGVYAEQIYTQEWLQQYNISNEFYFDAIRIYNPVVATDATASLAYYTDDEYNHDVVEIGQHLIDENTIDKLDDTAITGVIYLDDQGDLSYDGTTSDIGTYDKIGANNEVYLQKGDGISFLLTSDVLPDSIDIGAKIIQGGANAVLNVKGYSVKPTDGVTLAQSATQTVNVGTQQYFDMTDVLKELFQYNEASGKYEAYIVIWNTGADVLSITDIKLASGISSANNGSGQSEDGAADAQLLVNATAYSLGVRTIGEASNYDVAAASFTSESVKSTDQAQITVVTSQTVARLQVTDENGNVVESYSLYVDTATGDRVWTVSLTPINLGEQTFTVTGYNAAGQAGASVNATIMVTL